MKIINLKTNIFLLFLFIVSGNFIQKAYSDDDYLKLMAPLYINNQEEWNQFVAALAEAKKRGATSITTDVWWGVVEKKEGQFDFSYYHRIYKAIKDAGLKWAPILSTHQCGGNVGDNCNIPIPEYLWTKYTPSDPDALKFKSALGNISREVISVHGTKLALASYEQFFRKFYETFEYARGDIQEITLSLGPAGELRMPSYNPHDPKELADYPAAGVLQLYSDLAQRNFRASMKKKYQSLVNLNQAWGTQFSKWQDIQIPEDLSHNLELKKDVYDFNQESLLSHGRLLMEKAKAVFQGYKIGAKVPGVHWRMASDRLAELNAGLITARDPKQFQLTPDQQSPEKIGMDKVLQLFRDMGIVLHFTCLEMDNYENEAERGAKSLAKTLVYEVGKLAKEMGVRIMGENALSGALHNDRNWKNLNDALKYSHYEGLTLLRIDQMNDKAWNQLQAMAEKIRARMPARTCLETLSSASRKM